MCVHVCVSVYAWEYTWVSRRGLGGRKGTVVERRGSLTEGSVGGEERTYFRLEVGSRKKKDGVRDVITIQTSSIHFRVMSPCLITRELKERTSLEETRWELGVRVPVSNRNGR